MNKSPLLYFLFFIVNVCYGQNDAQRLKGLDQDIQTLLESYNAVGLSVSIVEEKNIIYSKGFGYRNLKNKLPVSENTSFHVASVTKAFTASLLGILASRDSISLKQKPSFYIPKLQFYNNEMDNLITIESLLSHKSGIGNLDGSLVLFPENNRLKALEKLKYLKPNGKINDSWLYSNAGYTIAGAVTEQVSGQSWDKNIESRIFNPLYMTNSHTDVQKMKFKNNYSLGYGLLHGEIKNVPFENYFDYSPAGAIKSSSNDLGNWMITWLNEGNFEGNQIIPQNYVYDATTIHNIRLGQREENSFLFGDGFGWRMESKNGNYKVYHGGNTSGFTSLVVLYPYKKLGITVLTNQQNSTLPYIIADIITNRMLHMQKMEISEYPIIVSDIYTNDKVLNATTQEKKTTYKLSDFCGKYFHQGYGKLEIKELNGVLYVSYPSITYRLEYLYNNTFKMKLDKNGSQILNPDFFELAFYSDNGGIINTMKINLAYEPIEFVKLITD